MCIINTSSKNFLKYCSGLTSSSGGGGGIVDQYISHQVELDNIFLQRTLVAVLPLLLQSPLVFGDFHDNYSHNRFHEYYPLNHCPADYHLKLACKRLWNVLCFEIGMCDVSHKMKKLVLLELGLCSCSFFTTKNTKIIGIT